MYVQCAVTAVCLWLVVTLNGLSANEENLLFTTIDKCGEAPTIDNGDVVHHYRVYLKYQCEDNYILNGDDTVLCFSNSSWSELPRCTNSSGSDDRTIGPIFTTTDKCGTPPTIANGDFLHENRIFLTYQCNLYYKLQGNSRVMCYGNGTWTTPPECIVDYCELDTTRYVHLKDAGVVFIKSGNQVKLGCHSSDRITARAHCTNRQLKVTRCCLNIMHKVGNCQFVKEEDSL